MSRPIRALRASIRVLYQTRSSPSQAIFGISMGVLITGLFTLVAWTLIPQIEALVAGVTMASFFIALYSSFRMLSEDHELGRELLRLEDEAEALIQEVEAQQADDDDSEAVD